MTFRTTLRLLSTLALAGLTGCVVAQQPGATTTVTSYSGGFKVPLGSITPVYNPPPGTPFRCTYIDNHSAIYVSPGDEGGQSLGFASSPVATMGARRGDWLLIVTRTGVIGWVYQPHEIPTSESPNHWIRYCNVHQDAQGRIVFHWKGVGSGEL